MYCQSNKVSPQLVLIDKILVFQSIYSFLIILIKIRTCLSSSTNISCLFVLLSNHVMSLSNN
ncbi:hypothetical protein F383_33659 [Gossypium arboreum]|uniref:Uncharacterized protein n=1 Tax=Gossypium arboreum TaxID=29729 RepID=A0A0B0N3U2_GOSAR|nr:hypothetical protein F383_33659 [Gossypium arboreum]